MLFSNWLQSFYIRYRTSLLWPTYRKIRRTAGRRRGSRPCNIKTAQVYLKAEELENRVLLTVNITGTADADDFLLQLNSDGSTVELYNHAEMLYSGNQAELAQLNIIGGAGRDTLTIDLSNGGPFPSGVIHFNGEIDGGTILVKDENSDTSYTKVYHYLKSDVAGFLSIDGLIISYEQTGSITDNLNASAREFDFAGSSKTVNLSAYGSTSDGLSRIDTSAGSTVIFRNPAESLTVSSTSGSNADTVRILDLDQSFAADLNVTGDENDRIELLATELQIEANHLRVTGQTIVLEGGVSSTSGEISLNSYRTTELQRGSSLRTVDGNITILSNMNQTAIGDFVGIKGMETTIETVGTGHINIIGAGSNDVSSRAYLADGHHGIQFSSGTVIRSISEGQDAGGISLIGSGGRGVYGNRGLIVTDTIIQSKYGDIHLTGQGGGDASGGFNDGIVVSDTEIASTGIGPFAATITLTGIGGEGKRSNPGVMLNTSDSALSEVGITTVDGAIFISGQGGGGSQSRGNTGISLRNFDIYSTGIGSNAGTITLAGIGGEGDKSNDGVVFYAKLNSADVASINSVDGDVLISGLAGENSTLGVYLAQAAVSSTGVGSDAAEIRIDSDGTYLARNSTRLESLFGNIHVLTDRPRQNGSGEFIMTDNTSINSGWGDIILNVHDDIFLTRLISIRLVSIESIVGSIFDNDDGNLNIFANSLFLQAGGGVGAEDNPLDISVDQQSVAESSYISNTEFRKIIQAGDPGFRMTGSWEQLNSEDEHPRFLSRPDAQNTATWIFRDLLPGIYRLSGHWTAASEQASNVSYTVSGNAGEEIQQTINQKYLTPDVNDAGVDWQDLGFVTVDSQGRIVVQVSNEQANGLVIADAMRIEKVDSIFSVSDIVVSEDQQTAVVTVVSSHAVGTPVSVRYSTTDRTAIAGSDYTLRSGTLNFTGDVDGEELTIEIPLNDDADVEMTEVFLVNLSDVVSDANVVIGGRQAAIQIQNDDKIIMDEDAGEQLIHLTDISTFGEYSQVVSVTAASSHPELIQNMQVDYAAGSTTGTVTYSPEADAHGEILVILTVTDQQGAQIEHLYSVVVNPVNDAPVAVDDIFTATEEAVLISGNVLSANDSVADSDVEGQPLTVSGVAGGSIGDEMELLSGALLTLYADGTFHYDLNGQFESLATGEVTTDIFTYTIQDTEGSTDTATVTITITGENDAPVISSTMINLHPENQDFVLDIDTIDPEGETESNGLVYSLTGGADLEFFQIDDTTGVITLNITPDFENPHDLDQDNLYEVVVSVIDSEGLRDDRLFQLSVTDVVDHWVFNQTYTELGYIEASGSGTSFHITVENMPEGAMARIIGMGIRGSGGFYNQTSSAFSLPEDGQISFQLERIPGWAPQLVIDLPSGSTHVTGIIFGENISETGSLTGVHGVGTTYSGDHTESLEIIAEQDPVWTDHLSQLLGLGLIDVLKQAETSFEVSGNRIVPAFEFVVEQNQLQIATVNFVEGFEVVIEQNGEVLVSSQVHAGSTTVVGLPDLSAELEIYLRDKATEIQIGPVYDITVTDGQTVEVLHRKVQLDTLAYCAELYDQILHADDLSKLQSAIENIKTSGTPDPKLIAFLESTLEILNGEITLYREENHFAAPSPWNQQFYHVEVDQSALPENAVEYAEINQNGVFQLKLLDDYQGSEFDITFQVSNGNHTRSVTTTFHLVTEYLVSLRNTIDQFTTFSNDLQNQLNELQSNYPLADSMDAQADEILNRYLQQINDPSQIVTPELHVIANRFQSDFTVEFQDIPEEGFSLRFAGGDLYPLDGREGTVLIGSLPRPDGHVFYPLELIDASGSVVQRVTGIKIYSGTISRVGAVNATFLMEILDHIPPVPLELQISVEEKEAAEQQKLDAAALRTFSDSQIVSLTDLRNQVLLDLAETQLELSNYENRYQIPRDTNGAVFEYVPEGAGYALEIRAWDSADYPAGLIAYDAFDIDGESAFKIDATLASIDMVDLPAAPTQFAADLHLRNGQSVTAYLFRGGEQVATQVVSESSSLVFENEEGYSAVVFMSESGTIYDISNIAYYGTADWDFNAERLSTQENRLIAGGVAPESWGTISSILTYPVYEWHLAENNILQYRANGMDGAHQNQYFLLGGGEGKFDNYTLFTPESTQGSPSLGGHNGVLYLNDDGWHTLPQKYYSIIYGALVMHPGSPRAIAVKVAQGSDVVVTHREAGSNFDTLFDSLTDFNPSISIQVLRQGSYPDPGYHPGIKEIQDGETPVIFNGEPFYVISTIWNTSAYSGPMVIDVYAGPESAPRAAYIGRFETSIGGFENKTLIVNATSPDVGEGRPSITFVRINADGSEDVVAGKHGRKAGRKTKAEKEAINDQKKLQHALVILDLIIEKDGVNSEQYASTHAHLEETFGISIPNAADQGGGDEPEPEETKENEGKLEDEFIAEALGIDVAEVDDLVPTESEQQLINTIRQLIAEIKDPRQRALRELREANPETGTDMGGVFLAEILESYRDAAFSELSGLVGLDLDEVEQIFFANEDVLGPSQVLSDSSSAIIIPDLIPEGTLILNNPTSTNIEIHISTEKFVNFWIEGNGNIDFRLTISGDNLSETYSSNNQGISGESISLKLLAGVYTISIDDLTNFDDAGNSTGAGSNIAIQYMRLHYNVKNYSPANIEGKISTSNRNQVVDVSMRIATFKADGERDNNYQNISGLDNMKSVWVVIHGRDNNENSPNIQYLANVLFQRGFQVLTVDWEDAADSIFLEGASWIQAVGKWAANQLLMQGFSGDKIIIPAHSWGTMVAYEIAENYKEEPNGNGFGVQSIIALDSPVDPFPNTYPIHNVVFNDVSRVSWALKSSIFGSNARSNTASVNFDILTPSESYENTPLLPPLNKFLLDLFQAWHGEHGYAVLYFANLINGRGDESLEVLNINDLIEGRLPDIVIDADNPEGILPVTLEDSDTNGIDIQVIPTFVQYIND